MTDEQQDFHENRIGATEVRDRFRDWLLTIGYQPCSLQRHLDPGEVGARPGFLAGGGYWVMPTALNYHGEPVLLKSEHSFNSKAGRKKLRGFINRGNKNYGEMWVWSEDGDSLRFRQAYLMGKDGSIFSPSHHADWFEIS